MKKVFTHNMFVLLLIPLLFLVIALFIVMNTDQMETWGMNKTVGWAWDLGNFIFLPFILYPVYLVGYGVLSLFKIKTNYGLTATHFGLIVLSLISFVNSDFSLITLFLSLLSLMVFLINTIYSITLKVKKT